MSQELRSVNLIAPGFKGLNTEDSPLAQDPSFAETADNAVIDNRGRIAARKGYVVQTANKQVLNNNPITTIGEYRDASGDTRIFSTGNNKIWRNGVTGPDQFNTSLNDVTPQNYIINSDNWKIVNFNSNTYFFQGGYQPLVSEDSNGYVVPMSIKPGNAGVDSAMYGNEVLAAYGRLWTADFTNDKSTIYWSDLLQGHRWEGGTSGSINISKVWPDGYDEIVALAAHNGLLIIFGKHSVVVYQNAESPSIMSLADTISGVGCVDRDTVQYTGTDVVFLSDTGLRSFGRTVQEKSMPISTLSKTITKDLIKAVQNETSGFKTVYSPEESFLLLTFISQKLTYCFDLRGNLEDGSLRVTRWPSSTYTTYKRTKDGQLFIGSAEGISTYKGYLDNNTTYRFKYESPMLSFGDSSKLKMLKKLRPIIVGGNNSLAVLRFAYDFSTDFRTISFTINDQVSAQFGINEFGPNSVPLSEFTSGEQLTNKRTFNARGSGNTIVIGLETTINGSEISLQEINVLALIGKTL